MLLHLLKSHLEREEKIACVRERAGSGGHRHRVRLFQGWAEELSKDVARCGKRGRARDPSKLGLDK